MNLAGDKPNTVQTTVRLREVTKDRLENAARIQRRPMNQVIEEALDEYFRARGFIERYVVKALNGNAILMKLNGEDATLMDMELLNGQPLRQVAERYAQKLQAPVAAEDDGEVR